MEERHWWFATKLQETFKFGGFDSPTLLEDFLSDSDVCDLLNRFLGAGEPSKLFFYCDKSGAGSSTSRRLHVTPKLNRDVASQHGACFYVLRKDPNWEVDLGEMEKELICGEIRSSALTTFTLLLTEAYKPLIEANKDWGNCSSEDVSQFLQNLEKFVGLLSEMSAVQESRRRVLELPRVPALSPASIGGSSIPSIIVDLEGVVSDWITTIDRFLTDALEDRSVDPTSLPLNEVKKWKNRLILLTSIVEQVKSKDCSSVITVLVAAKSKTLKKWKIVDAHLTRAYIDAKDKGRFLEGLQLHFEDLAICGDPDHVIKVVLPGIAANIIHPAAISYMKSGYLGVLLAKVTNSLVLVCLRAVKSVVSKSDKLYSKEDIFWIIMEEATDAVANSTTPSAEHRLLKVFDSCQQLKVSFHDFLVRIKEQLLNTVSLPGVVTALGSSRTKLQGGSSSVLLPLAGKGKKKKTSDLLTDSGTPVLAPITAGIHLSDLTLITSQLDLFCTRVDKIKDMILSMGHFYKFSKSAIGLPYAPENFWSLSTRNNTLPPAIIQQGPVVEPPETKQAPKQAWLQHIAKGSLEEQLTEDEGIDVDTVSRTSTPDDPKLPVAHSSTDKHGSEGVGPGPVPEVMYGASNNLTALAKEGSLSALIQLKLQMIWQKLQQVNKEVLEDNQPITDLLFATFGPNKDIFDVLHSKYTSLVDSIEGCLSSYTSYLFKQKMTSMVALKHIQAFVPISSRPSLKGVVQDFTMAALRMYVNELEELTNHYEQHKNSPEGQRGAPFVKSSLVWCRQLYQKMDAPMKVFTQKKAISQTNEMTYSVKLYNKLARALVKYETMVVQQWSGDIPKRLQVHRKPLLVSESVGEGKSVVKVNSAAELLLLIEEGKGVGKLGIEIPEALRGLLQQESKVKYYKQHLECILSGYYNVYRSTELCLLPLLQPHAAKVMRALQPGWSTLTWSSLNIDAFLHQAYCVLENMQQIARSISTINRTVVQPLLQEIGSLELLDLNKLGEVKSWTPDSFLVQLSQELVTSAKKMEDRATLFEEGLGDILQAASIPGPTTTIPPSEPSRGSPPSHATKERGKLVVKSVPGKQEKDTITKQQFGSCKTVQGSTMSFLNSGGSQRGTLNMDQSDSSKQSLAVKLQHLSHSSTASLVVEYFSEELLGAVKRAVLTCMKCLYHALSSPQKELKDIIPTSKSHHITFMLGIQFFIPDIIIHPSLRDLCDAVGRSCLLIVDALKGLHVWKTGLGRSQSIPVVEILRRDPEIVDLKKTIIDEVAGLRDHIVSHINSLSPFDPLWQDDMHSYYQSFVDQSPTIEEVTEKVEMYFAIEKDIANIPEQSIIGCIQLTMEPMKNSLLALARCWKFKFSTFLHDRAKMLLDEILERHKVLREKLQGEVNTLEDLRETIHLLHEVLDLENLVDDHFLSVEKLYDFLKKQKIRLPRTEIQQVDQLRNEWRSITELAEQVQHCVLSEQRLNFERESDNKVNEFNVETKQFRNSFDSEGPLVPGLSPAEAVARLGSFLAMYKNFEAKAALLNTVQRQLDKQITPFFELEQTGIDLGYLSSLYENYQKFIDFDLHFRDQLWAQVDITKAISKVEGFWKSCQALPAKQKEWDASKKLSAEISDYRNILPLLKKLHSKEIKNRHWLRIMTVTGCTLQLEANVFRLKHLMAAKLMNYQNDIEDIIANAQQEQLLEIQLNDIEEEWTEQSLQFDTYKNYGNVILSQSYCHCLLEQLDHAHTSLSVMLKSPFVTPHQDEASQWSLKLTSITDALQKWLAVQDLWQNLEAVFTNEGNMKEFNEELRKFTSLNETWLKLMQTASQRRNVINCCLGEDITRGNLLGKLQQELEECKKSLSVYLKAKKQAFPRFNFISDSVLLGILSAPDSVESILPFLPALFGSIASIGVTYVPNVDFGPQPILSSVQSLEGEQLEFSTAVQLKGNVEKWLNLLLEEVKSTLKKKATVAIAKYPDTPLEDFIQQNTCQAACVAVHQHWTEECEKALSVCRYDRRAIPGNRNKFNNSVVTKLVNLLGRGKWKQSNIGLTVPEKKKLESLTLLAIGLRDICDDLVQRKLRDVNDFEWQRFPRIYSYYNLTVTEHSFAADPKSQATPHQPGELLLSTRCLEVDLPYAYEYTGCQSYPVFTSRSFSCIVALTQALSKFSSCELVGPVGSGKVGMVEGLGLLCGRNVTVLQCTRLTAASSLTALLSGCAQSSVWCCFAGATNLSSSVLAVLGHLLYTINGALKMKLAGCLLPNGQQIPVRSGFGVFVTRRDGDKSSVLPSYMQELFRSFSLTLPPLSMVFRVHAALCGYKNPKQLADRLVMFYTLVREQLSETALSLQSLLDAIRNSAIAANTVSTKHLSTFPSDTTLLSPMHAASINKLNGDAPVITSSKVDHKDIVKGLVEFILPRYPDVEKPVFLSILRDTFVGVISPQQLDNLLQEVKFPPLSLYERYRDNNLGFQSFSHLSQPASESCPTDITIGTELSLFLAKECQSMKLILHQPWLDKAKQISSILKEKDSVVVAGVAGSGKTTCIDALIAAENAMQRSREGEEAVPVKLHRIFPQVYENVTALYGELKSNGDWSDGVFTALLRKALRAQQSANWFCFDGPLSPLWVDQLSSLLVKSKTFQHPNGDLLSANGKNMKFFFETGDLKDASPVALTYCGLVYFDMTVLNWRVLFESWLSTRRPQEVHCLTKWMDSVIEPVCRFTAQAMGSDYCETGQISTTLSYLRALLDIYAETAEAFSESHVEKLFLFSVIWGFGGSLSDTDQTEFSTLLSHLTNCLPDDDTADSVFHYYVDESGEWDVWGACIPKNDYSAKLDPINDLFIETAQSVCVKTLLELAHNSRQHILLVGPKGIGKTAVVNNFLSQRGIAFSKTECVRKLTFNGHTNTHLMHSFIQIHFHRRQGQTYGPFQGKLMNCFLDDIHLPTQDKNNNMSEYLRQLVDVKGLYNLSRDQEWSNIEDIVIFSNGSDSSKEMTLRNSRLRRHFAVIRFPTVTQEDTACIIQSLAEGYLHCKEANQSVSKEMVSILARVTTELYSEVAALLRSSTLPGRHHYMFSITQVAQLFKGILQCLSSATEVPPVLHFFWRHEATRVFSGGISRERDYLWLAKRICHHTVTIRTEGSLWSETNPDMLAVTGIPLNVKTVKGAVETELKPVPKYTVSMVTNWNDLRPSLSHYVSQYQNEFGGLDVPLSNVFITDIIRIHRAILSSSTSIIISESIDRTTSLVHLALYIGEYKLMNIDFSEGGGIQDVMQTLLKQAGLDRKQIAAIFTEEDLKDDRVLQFLSTYISSGELPLVFSNDEEHGIYQAMAPAIRRDFPGKMVDPSQYLNKCIQNNLRIILCLPSSHPLVNKEAPSYPSLIHSSTVIDLCEWRPLVLECSALDIIDQQFQTVPNADTLKMPLSKCICGIHTTMLQETSHLSRAGFYPQREQLDSSTRAPPFEEPKDKGRDSTFGQDILEEENKECLLSVEECEVNELGEQNASMLYDHIPSLRGKEGYLASGMSLQEKMYHLFAAENGQRNLHLPYVGPVLLEQFTTCVCKLYLAKIRKANKRKSQLSGSLGSLKKIADKVESLRSSLLEYEGKYKETAARAALLMEELSSRKCQWEVLGARLGQESSVLGVMRIVQDQERLLSGYEDDASLLDVLIDSSGKRSSSVDKLIVEAERRLEEANEEEKALTEQAKSKEEEAVSLLKKIDRNIVDQVKSLNSPPYMVGIAMELVIRLLKPSTTEARSIIESDGSTSLLLAGDGASLTSARSGTKSRKSAPSLVSLKNTSALSDKSSRRLAKDQWSRIQLAIGDSQRFQDLLHNLSWENGLSQDAVTLLDANLATSRNNDPAESESVEAKRKMAPVHLVTGKELIAVPVVKHASEAAGLICMFVLSVMEYHYLLEPCKRARERVAKLQKEVDSLKSRELPSLHDLLEKSKMPLLEEDVSACNASDLDTLQKEVDTLFLEFDTVAVEKHKLNELRLQFAERLKTANQLLNNLKDKKGKWKTELEAFAPERRILGECIMAGAFVVYGAGLKPTQRGTVLQWVQEVLKKHNFSTDPGFNVVNKLFGKCEMCRYRLEDLPTDVSSAESASAVVAVQQYCTLWPLICDKYGIILQWLRKRQGKRLVTVSPEDPYFHKKLFEAMLNGWPLVFNDIKPIELVQSEERKFLFSLKQLLLRSRSDKVKLKIKDKEIECSTDFQIFFVYNNELSTVSRELAQQVIMIDFSPQRTGLEDYFLVQLLDAHNKKTCNDWQELHKNVYQDSVELQQLEEKMLELLSTEEHLDEGESAKRLASLNQAHLEVSEHLSKTLDCLADKEGKALADPRATAHRLVPFIKVICNMDKLNPAYKTCYSQVAPSLIQLAGRTQGESSTNVLPRLTESCHSLFVQSFSENDQTLFTLMVALEIEESNGNILPLEKEIYIKPFAGSTYLLKGINLNQGGSLTDLGKYDDRKVYNFTKCPFDWMKENTWKTMQLLCTHYQWAIDIMQNIKLDGNESSWRMIYEIPCPELFIMYDTSPFRDRPLPKHMKRMTPFQRLLCLRTLRPKRISQCTLSFCAKVFDKSNVSGIVKMTGTVFDTLGLLNLNTSKWPEYSKQAILLLFKNDALFTIPWLYFCADRAKRQLQVVPICGNVVNFVLIERMLRKAIANGKWILLHCVHTSPKLLQRLPALMQKLQEEVSDNGFRLWLSSDSSSTLPIQLLHSSFKLSIESPKNLKQSLIHSIMYGAGPVLSASTKPDWLPLLHNLSLLHALVRLRRIVYEHSWTKDYQWNFQCFVDIVKFAANDFISVEKEGTGSRLVSWAGIRHMVTEVVYGSCVTDASDQAALVALTEHLIHPIGARKDTLDIPKFNYVMPGAFKVPGNKLQALVFAIATANPHPVLTAEICGFHLTSEVNLSIDPDMIKRFKKFLTEMSQLDPSQQFDQSLIESVPPHITVKTSFEAKRQGHFLGTSFNIQERSLSLYTSGSSVSTRQRRVTFGGPGQSSSTMRSRQGSALIRFRMPFEEVIEKCRSKVNCKWKQDILNEKLAKFQNDDNFQFFLSNEVHKMMHCFAEIQSDIFDLDAMLKFPMQGNCCPDKLAKCAYDLMNQRTPEEWTVLAGDTSPPQTWPAVLWISSLNQRYHFLDKVLNLNHSNEKVPIYNIGAFLNPTRFFSLFKQDALRKYSSKKEGEDSVNSPFALITVKAVPTNRETEHIRDPPTDGIFANDLYIWGVEWEKNAALELLDNHPKSHLQNSLPLLHITAIPSNQLDSQHRDHSKGPYLYPSPCYNTATNPGEFPLLYIHFESTDIMPSRWPIRGVKCYLKPF